MKIEDIQVYADHVQALPQVYKWIDSTLKDYLDKNQPSLQEVEHIIDYLCSDKAPERIERMPYDEAKSNAEKWTESLIKKGEEIKEAVSDTEVVLDFGDGFKIVKLIGENAYKREGFLMRHCVADYFGRNIEIFSLRDEENMPHCTIEKDQQVKGKGNGEIHPKYVEYIVKFLEYTGMTVGDSEMLNLGYISVEKFKDHLGEKTLSKLFNDKYLSKNEKLFDKKGSEFATLDLLDQIPLISETRRGLKINFDLPAFIKLSIDSFFKQNASSGKDSKNASSGDYPRNVSSGNNSKNASSGNNSKNASSGNYSQNASSGSFSKNASSGDHSKNASSGDNSQNASSGDNSQNASFGSFSKNASSGKDSKNASSGNYSQNASSGSFSQNASSGSFSKNASSGDHSKNASSGDNSQNASSGDNSQNASFGSFSKNASSGRFSKIEMTGKNSVGAAIGRGSEIKGIKGSWITLAEYNNEGICTCVKSAQIDGKELKADTWYKLQNGEFVEAKNN